jgi:hypothetical protein
MVSPVTNPPARPVISVYAQVMFCFNYWQKIL